MSIAPPAGGDGALGVDSRTLATLVKAVPEELLADALNGSAREQILGEVFRRFPEQLSQAGRRTNAVIKWRIAAADGSYERWFVVLRNGECETGRDLSLKPRVTLTVGPVDFIKIVTGNVNPVELFVRRKLKLRGDLPFAARIPSLFRIPTAG